MQGCALTPESLFKLANKNNINLPTDDGAFASAQTLPKGYQEFTSLDDLYAVCNLFCHTILIYHAKSFDYYISMSVFIDSSDFETLAWDDLQHPAADGVMHAERFMAARKQVEQELGITTRLILCLLRLLPAQEYVSTSELLGVYASVEHSDIIGVVLDFSQYEFPPHLFSATFYMARVSGLRRFRLMLVKKDLLPISPLALDDLGVERIDHGIRLAEDPVLLKRIAEQGTLLTICPMSNVFLRCISDIAELPIRKFPDESVSVSLNSDDPAY